MVFQNVHSHSQGQCSHCLSEHRHSAGVGQSRCFFITIRRSGRAPVPCTVSASGSLPLPSSTLGRSKLRDIIWKEFESIKVENEYSRDQMLSRRSSRKGDLRTEAPIPWLRWRSPWGEEGQTRKRENFEQIWNRSTRGSQCLLVRCTFLSNVGEEEEDASEQLATWRGSVSSSKDGDSWSSGSTSSTSRSASSNYSQRNIS